MISTHKPGTQLDLFAAKEPNKDAVPLDAKDNGDEDEDTGKPKPIFAPRTTFWPQPLRTARQR